MRSKLEEQIRELEERMEALIIAIPKEEAAYHFYLDLANTTSHAGTRKMFLTLAEHELDHRHSLETITEEIKREIARLKAEHSRAKKNH